MGFGTCEIFLQTGHVDMKWEERVMLFPCAYRYHPQLIKLVINHIYLNKKFCKLRYVNYDIFHKL